MGSTSGNTKCVRSNAAIGTNTVPKRTIHDPYPAAWLGYARSSTGKATIRICSRCEGFSEACQICRKDDMTINVTLCVNHYEASLKELKLA